MNRNIHNYAALLIHTPHASAELKGSGDYPDINGSAQFYQTKNGVLIAAEINCLPHFHDICQHPIFGFHIHDGSCCKGNVHDPFSAAMSHYNPEDCAHPSHAGDLPPLFGNHGYAFSVFLTDRLSVPEIIGKTLIIHGNPDDFTTQPSGNAGKKLACGVITMYSNRYKQHICSIK